MLLSVQSWLSSISFAKSTFPCSFLVGSVQCRTGQKYPHSHSFPGPSTTISPSVSGKYSIAITCLQTQKNLGKTTFNSVKLQEYKYYTCISPEPTKCELLDETQTPDLCKRKHSRCSLSMILAVNATVQRVTEFICLYWSNIKRSQAGILSPWSEAWYHLLLTHLTNCALKDILVSIR